MRKACLGCAIVLVVACIACPILAYFFGLPKAQDAVADDLADIVQRNVTAGISAAEVSSGTIVLTADDLDVNNSFSSDVGINITNGDTDIHGFSTVLSSTGVTLIAGDPDDLEYTAVPVVENDLIRFDDVDSGPGRWHIVKFLLSEDGFASGFEDGINAALSAKGLTPVAVTTANGTMTIETTPRSQTD